MQDLGSSFVALGINNSGQVVGGTYAAPNYAVLWSAGTITEIGAPDSFATAINDPGQIVGQAFNGNGGEDPFLYSGGTTYDLGTLGGGRFGSATDINNSGNVVGWCQNSGGYYRAFLSTDGGPLVDLGTLGGNQAIAKAINDSGLIVGVAETSTVIPPPIGPEYVPEAFISDNGGPMQNLNSLIDPASGWTITDVTDINELGQIVGLGTKAGLQQEEYVLLPPISTPEPSTLALLAATAAAVVGCRLSVVGGRKGPEGGGTGKSAKCKV